MHGWYIIQIVLMCQLDMNYVLLLQGIEGVRQSQNYELFSLFGTFFWGCSSYLPQCQIQDWAELGNIVDITNIGYCLYYYYSQYFITDILWLVCPI